MKKLKLGRRKRVAFIVWAYRSGLYRAEDIPAEDVANCILFGRPKGIEAVERKLGPWQTKN